MKTYERDICFLIIQHIKKLTGRGPKNIHSKIDENKIEIHFWLQKTPLEKYACDELQKGKCLVSEIYRDVLQHRVKDIENELSIQFERKIKFYYLDVDIDKDKYILRFLYDEIPQDV